MAAVKQLRNTQTGEILIARLEIADSAWQRVVGLIGRARLAPDAALWLQPCNGIHTFGVRFPIDVLFLDAQGSVLCAVQNVKPCRLCGPVWKAKTVVELPVGTLAKGQVRVGMKFDGVV